MLADRRFPFFDVAKTREEMAYPGRRCGPAPPLHFEHSPDACGFRMDHVRACG